MLDLRELELDFEAEYWAHYNDEEEFAETEEQKRDRLLAEDLSKEMDSLTEYFHEDAVTHFLEKKCIEFDDEGRYFYKRKELVRFAKDFTARGGNLDDLGCWIVKNDDGRFYCYEVVRKKYIDRVKLESKSENAVDWKEVI